ncbi:MAG: hypothetical protein LBD97_01250 [Bifidobacteriaceae bacterium]|jgi:hypothetical protein|nr:hypothetical protein [Bifidobacteriaceae bacterium]
MPWSLAADAATALGVLVAIISVIVTAVFGVRAERAAATRAERAAALSDDNLRRAIEALERIADQSAAGTAVAQPKVAWKLTHQKGDTYLTENVGDRAARQAEVDTAPDAHMVFRRPDPRDLAPGEALTFVAARSMATSDSTMTVSWIDEDDHDRHLWHYPLPPRPPRGG